MSAHAKRSAGLIALDLDGTLEDSRDDMVAAVLRVREAFGLPPRPGEGFRAHVNGGMAHLYRVCFEELLADPPTHARACEAYVADYAAHIAEATRLYPEMADALAELSELGPLAIVTNKPEGLSERLLTALGVRERFAVVIGGDSCPEAKPSPVPLRIAAQRVGLSSIGDSGDPPVLMIGDSAGDVRCGKAAGAAVIWCAWGYAPGLSFGPGEPSPDHTAATPRELPELVRAVLASS
ncbi:HAD family hydrolase [Paraliomyxa miuraensis]|uniref:HAD family hydrolase n=1 Tax=Paraliomyxa miuraensis TaxID=376150 RepID=UPI0022562010|nr:HAD-IA family hydrolase [Paraliomyxa miuraensis]MCX4242023.1 HAD-IA family hydrolase [Paraliomyxa miuraensis]